ncbi:MAG: ribonuclease PH [Bdellovibrionaceae bacterium]|nr:ribonuclease PH [Pseudobdellovibrionaceae bacterium]
MRIDSRNPNNLRSLNIYPEVIRYAEGSVRIELGNTHLICTASVEEGIPKWLMGKGSGWITAEYGMLPRSTHTRIQRDRATNSGRSQEISRLIGRSLRSAVDMEKLGEKQIYIDCDVIQADGGTRTAAITGGFVALALALKFLFDQKQIKEWPIKYYLAAVSVGLKGQNAILDLNYDEDSTVDTDMNFVMNNKNDFIEIQGTAEKTAFTLPQLQSMIELAQSGCQELFKKQEEIIGNFFPLES